MHAKWLRNPRSVSGPGTYIAKAAHFAGMWRWDIVVDVRGLDTIDRRFH